MNKAISTVYVLLITCSILHGQTADFTADTLIGCDSLTVQFTDLSSGALTWEWDFNDDGITDSQEQNPVYTFSEGGQYSITLRINNSISHTKTNYISVLAVDSVFWFNDTLDLSMLTYVFRNSVQIGEPAIDYQRTWTFSDNTTASGRTVMHQFPDTGLYQVELNIIPVDLPQCATSYSKSLEVRDEIYIPNVFTPNGDGLNDYFIVEYNGTSRLNFHVYSRYGNLVYKLSAPLITWDGNNLSGNEVNPGVYYFVLSSDDGEVNKSGFIHLFR